MSQPRKAMLFKKTALTLIELLIAIVLMGAIMLGLYSIDMFSRYQVVNSGMRVKVQNEVSNALEHMNKYVQQACGDITNPAITWDATGKILTVNICSNSLVSNAVVTYTWDPAAYTLTTNCTGLGCSGSFLLNEILSRRIINFSPDVTINGSSVEVYLAGRYKAGESLSQTNPQVEMKMKIACSSCSTN